MGIPNGSAQRRDSFPRDLFEGRSFVVASNPPRDEQRALEQAIEERGGSVHPFLNAVTDVLVVGTVTGNSSEAHWAREQVRRGEGYRARWGHLEFITEEALRMALGQSPGGEV
ncbi:MAG TPA: BRCT domain-containing protein [Thermoanaerobaculia bacterium]|nr:BRCT domain-containing protein [Thermoanaerobaculia bacterium]